jgi:hypothetical protein
MYRRQQSEELPHDLALSINRILDLNTSPESDPLEVIGDSFNVVQVLNEYFPNGASCAQGSVNTIIKGLAMFFTRGITRATRCSTSAADPR